jgi:hypothetical protein
MNCWEFKKCGCEKGGKNSIRLGICPAYPNNGLQCAQVTGTLCGGKTQGTIASKLIDCMQCEFYTSSNYQRRRSTVSR